MIIDLKKTLAVSFALLIALPGYTADKVVTQNRQLAKAEQPVVSDAWARATMPGQAVGAAYLRIHSSRPVKLTHVETSAAKQVQIHTMHKHDGVMQMRALDGVEVPAGKMIELTPGGTHLMLLGLKQPLKAGEGIPMQITFAVAANRKTMVDFLVEVRPLGQ